MPRYNTKDLDGEEECQTATIIYVDVLLVINFIINFLMLRLTALGVGRPASAWRLSIGALLGALGALSIFVSFPNRVIWIAYRILLAGGMAAAALPWEGIGRLGKATFCLVAVSFLFSGGMIALFLTLRPVGMLMTHGVLYLDLSATALLGATALCFVLASCFERMLHRRAPSALVCEVSVSGQGGVCHFFALLDTGNQLCEPFSGKPVIVCEEEVIAQVLPELVLGQIDTIDRTRLRYIFYQTIADTGMLPAVEPLFLMLRRRGGEWKRVRGVYLAASKQSLQLGECRAIANPAVLGEENVVNHQKVGEIS